MLGHRGLGLDVGVQFYKVKGWETQAKLLSVPTLLNGSIPRHMGEPSSNFRTIILPISVSKRKPSPRAFVSAAHAVHHQTQ